MDNVPMMDEKQELSVTLLEEDFHCPICYRLLVDPVVKVCGHAFCLCCAQRSMNSEGESRCPLCRGAHAHLPARCGVLQSLIHKAFPATAARHRQEAEEDDKNLHRMIEALAGGPSRVPVVPPELGVRGGDADGAASASSGARGGGSGEGHEEGRQLGEERGRAAEEMELEAGGSPRGEGEGEGEDGGAVTLLLEPVDLACASCSQVLQAPVVLNCGHVLCSGCVPSSSSLSGSGSGSASHAPLCCPACRARHPGPRPRVCQVLQELLERAGLAAADADSQEGSPVPAAVPTGGEPSKDEAAVAGAAAGTGGAAGEPSLAAVGHNNLARLAVAQRELLRVRLLQQSADDGGGEEGGRAAAQAEIERIWEEHYIHWGVGCDACGAYPIVGERHKCLDCPERIGFDLCGFCKQMPQEVLHGRFGQTHTATHRMELRGLQYHRRHHQRLLTLMAEAEAGSSRALEELTQHVDGSDSEGEE